MPTRRELLLLGLVGVGAAVAGALVGPLTLQSRTGAARLLSARYRDLEGRTTALSLWQGSPLLCNFWATWCAPCREEVPLLLKLRAHYAGKGVEFVGIGIDNAAKMRQFSNEYRVTYPLLEGDAGTVELMRDLGNPSGALPFTVLTDRAGAIAYRHLGLLREPDLRTALDGILG